MKRARFNIAVLGIVLITGGCATSSKRLVWKKDRESGRKIASISGEDNGSAFDQALLDLGLHAYTANLHAHHPMSSVNTRGGESEDEGEEAGANSCVVGGRFPEDDGRPCRNNESKQNANIAARDSIDYFKMACEYGRDHGDLDVLFITPHSKDGKVQPDTSTLGPSYVARQKLLKDLNASSRGRYYCGLGQEASSISSGNHINILGHFGEDAPAGEPFFFTPGAFNDFYPRIKARIAKGENLLLQLNHPGVRDDLWWGSVSTIPKKQRKEKLNDYGLDDYAPVGCLMKADKVPGCSSSSPKELSLSALRETFAKIREDSGDPFRLIEVISPQVLSANPEKKGSKSRKTGLELPPMEGATTNPSTEFKSVNLRLDSNGLPGPMMQEVNEGLYDYVFYLNMGFRLSPTANQDNHHMNWGSATSSRTGFFASSLDEHQIISALQQRRTFASEDKNARVVLYGEERDDEGNISTRVMGSELRITGKSASVMIGYQDPDEKDHAANVRLYYYRENESLDFNHRAEPNDIFRLVNFVNNVPVLPRGPTVGYSQVPSQRDSIPIVSGQVVQIDLPLEDGLQYVFAEITQSQDGDKIYTAPLWIRK